MDFREFLKSWLPVFLWIGLIFFNSSDVMSAEHTSRFVIPFLRWLKPNISWQTILQIHFFLRKAAHVTEYAIFSGLFFRALRPSIQTFWKRGALAFAPALIVAPLDEWHQSFVPSRTSSARDVLIDYCGAIAGILLCRLLYMILRGPMRADASLGQRRSGPERI